MSRYSRRKNRVISLYGNNCIYCGSPLDASIFSIEHVIPKAKGGTNRIENLRPACKPCNNQHMNPNDVDHVPGRKALDILAWKLKMFWKKEMHRRKCWQSYCIPHA